MPITGALTYQSGTNANGISATPDGKALLIVQSNTGRLFRSTYAGKTTKISLNGESLLNGDGMWLRGSILYVVQNRDNAITKLQLDLAAHSANVLSRTKDARFDVPTAVAEWNGDFYLPNARLTTPATRRDDLQRGRACPFPRGAILRVPGGSVPIVVRRWVARDRAT